MYTMGTLGATLVCTYHCFSSLETDAGVTSRRSEVVTQELTSIIRHSGLNVRCKNETGDGRDSV